MFWIVWTPQQQYLPSIIYFTREDAITAAEREAAANRGLKYYVFKVVTTLRWTGGKVEQTEIETSVES